MLLKVPPAVVGQRAKGPVDQAGDELATSDEERVDGDELSSLMGGGNFSYVDGDSHGGDAWRRDVRKETSLEPPAVLEEQVGQLTYAQAHGDPAHQEHLLAGGQTQDDAADAEDEAGDKDADASAQPAVQEAPPQGGERRRPNGAGHQQLLPQVVQVHLLLQGQHGAGHHPGVVPKEEPPQGREGGQHVNKAGSGGGLPSSRLLSWGLDEVLLPISGSPDAQKVPHLLQAEFIRAAGHGGRKSERQPGAASAQLCPQHLARWECGRDTGR